MAYNAGANSRPALGFSAAPISRRRFIPLWLSSVMHLAKKVAAWVFLLAFILGLLVSGSFIPDTWWHAMPVWLKVGLAGLGVLSGLVVIADFVMRLSRPGQRDDEKA